MKKRFIVEGMNCASCVHHVQKAVESLEGVHSADIDLSIKRMDVEMNESVHVQTIIDAVKNAGYEAFVHIDTKEVTLNIKGMTCSNCVLTLEKALKKTQGVVSAKINLTQNTALISYEEPDIDLSKIIKVIENQGYQVDNTFNYDDFTDYRVGDDDLKKQFTLFISMGFTILLVYISMGEMFGFILPSFMDPLVHPFVLGIVQLILFIPLLYIGRCFYLKGFKNLWKKTPNLDSLFTLGFSASVLYSLYALVMILNTGVMQHLYFETAAIIVTVIMLGKYLEILSKGIVSATIRDLLSLTPEKSLLLIENDQEQEILVKDILVGNFIVIKPGDKVPVDGRIIKGSTFVDESMITGDASPVSKEIGQMVIQGSINNSELIIIEAKRVGKDTTLSKIIELVEKAEKSKAPIAKLADKISLYFVPSVLLLSLLSMIVWFIAGKSIGFSFTLGMTVLIIACPCALGLATPSSIIVGTGIAAKHGIIFKDGETIENAHKIDAIVFDKTETLTENRPVVNEVFPLSISEKELMSLIYSAEKNSIHPLAFAIKRYVEDHPVDTLTIGRFKETPGKGIEFSVSNQLYFLGSKKYLKQMGIVFKNIEVSVKNKSVIFIGSNSKVLGYVTISDQVKSTAFEMIKQINALEIETHILSGDNYEATAMVADSLKIKNIHANVLPEDKYKVIKKLQKLGKKVAMVGDGINDSIALTQADIGISLTSSTDVAITTADIILMSHDLMDIVKVLDMSKNIIKNVKQNLFWAFAYNAIGFLFAAGVVYAFGGPLINPLMAAFVMLLSSITVILNALRIKKYIYK